VTCVLSFTTRVIGDSIRLSDPQQSLRPILKEHIYYRGILHLGTDSPPTVCMHHSRPLVSPTPPPPPFPFFPTLSFSPSHLSLISSGWCLPGVRWVGAHDNLPEGQVLSLRSALTNRDCFDSLISCSQICDEIRL
jgi:hypothetical protein